MSALALTIGDLSRTLQQIADGPHSLVVNAGRAPTPRTQTPVNPDAPEPDDDWRSQVDMDDEGPEFWDDEEECI